MLRNTVEVKKLELKLKIPSLTPPPNTKTVSNLQLMFDG